MRVIAVMIDTHGKYARSSIVSLVIGTEENDHWLATNGIMRLILLHTLTPVHPKAVWRPLFDP
jgi:hypothetical protein